MDISVNKRLIPKAKIFIPQQYYWNKHYNEEGININIHYDTRLGHRFHKYDYIILKSLYSIKILNDEHID